MVGSFFLSIVLLHKDDVEVLKDDDGMDGSLFSQSASTDLESVLVESRGATKRQSKYAVRQSKRPMYCRNAYTHYLVRKIVMYNPYISLQEILHILEERHVECKDVTVSKIRIEERQKLLTPMKDVVSALTELRMDIINLP